MDAQACHTITPEGEPEQRQAALGALIRAWFEDAGAQADVRHDTVLRRLDQVLVFSELHHLRGPCG
jgi:hypothetical protein